MRNFSKNYYTTLSIGSKKFSGPYGTYSKIIYFYFVRLLTNEKSKDKKFFPPSLLLLFLDPGTEIRGPDKNPNPGSGIRDKHPGSVTLVTTY